jgi:ABC-type nitrate/sulfonate/bicarbonate transport system ATPase subunit
MDGKNVKNLIVKNLSVKFNSNLVLDNLNLEVKEGEFTAVIGKSGCGKTTLLNAIAGFIKYKGYINKPEKIGIVFQNYAVFPWLSVKGNISFGLEKDDNNKTVNHYLEIIDLKDKKNNYPIELSGGQIQRIAIARTLASNPDLILMDEPFGALDVFTRDKMQKWLLDIWQNERKTILFVTHSIEEAIFLADRVCILKNKKIKREIVVKFKRPRSELLKFDNRFIKLKKKISKII